MAVGALLIAIILLGALVVKIVPFLIGATGRNASVPSVTQVTPAGGDR